MKLLFLGGTGNISTACVDRAVEEGHQVTVLNRGRIASRVRSRVDVVAGDRGDGAFLRQVAEGARFDAVVDFIAFRPEQVEVALEAFAAKLHPDTARVCPAARDRLVLAARISHGRGAPILRVAAAARVRQRSGRRRGQRYRRSSGHRGRRSRSSTLRRFRRLGTASEGGHGHHGDQDDLTHGASLPGTPVESDAGASVT